MSAQSNVRNSGPFALSPAGAKKYAGFAGSKAWAAALAVSIFISFILALSMVWVNTQRAGLGYELKRMQLNYAELQSYNSKLEVERDRMLSPYYLGSKAKAMRLRSAEQGQKRVIAIDQH